MIDKNNYNIKNLIYDADFEVKLCNDLYWVPLNELGKTRKTNNSFDKFENYNLSYIQSQISCVYEAVQYLNYIGFSENKDVTIMSNNGVDWVYHSTGIEAIKNSYGICTSVASAMKYLCEEAYEYIGYLLFVRPDTSYHILCYIQQNNQYYIFDPSAYVYGSIEDIIPETGNKKDMQGRLFTSICFRTSNLRHFVKFYQRILLYKNIHFVFIDLYHRKDCINKMAIIKTEKAVSVYFPPEFDFNVINKENSGIYTVKNINS